MSRLMLAAALAALATRFGVPFVPALGARSLPAKGGAQGADSMSTGAGEPERAIKTSVSCGRRRFVGTYIYIQYDKIYGI